MLSVRLVLAVVVATTASPVIAQRSAPSGAGAGADQIAQGCSGPGPTQLPARMGDLAPEKLTEAQQQAVVEFGRVRGGAGRVSGPYMLLLRSPEVLVPTATLGEYLQNKSPLPEELKQFVIAITARQWTQQYQWNVHCPSAVRAGLGPEIAHALLEGERPVGMSDDEALVYDLVDELYRTHSVADATYARAIARFGEQGLIDLIGLNAYYTFLAMEANTSRLPVGSGVPNLPAFPR